MGVTINYVRGTARCSEHGDAFCDHKDRLRRRFGLWAYHAERRAEREGQAFPEFRDMAVGMAGQMARAEHILALQAERPLAARLDESPLPQTTKGPTT